MFTVDRFLSKHQTPASIKRTPMAKKHCTICKTAQQYRITTYLKDIDTRNSKPVEKPKSKQGSRHNQT